MCSDDEVPGKLCFTQLENYFEKGKKLMLILVVQQ